MGQHFLEPVWADKVVEAINPAAGDRFLEIGPGHGILTLRLAPRVSRRNYVSIGLRGPVCTGPNRGKAHCYICEAADRPTVIVLARKMTEPLGKLVQGLDQALTTPELNQYMQG